MPWRLLLRMLLFAIHYRSEQNMRCFRVVSLLCVGIAVVEWSPTLVRWVPHPVVHRLSGFEGRCFVCRQGFVALSMPLSRGIGLSTTADSCTTRPTRND